jgi:Ser/Thr protein kinase RdoA (MazF antagonist)
MLEQAVNQRNVASTVEVESMATDEQPLDGGNISQVVRIGDTVHRQVNHWSHAVHGLLRHLERQGFDGSPRFIGIDERGREILTYIPGEVGAYPLPPYMWSDATLTDAGRMLRRLHDATVTYAPPNAPWQFVYPEPSLHEVICHNDIAPYNAVFVDGRLHAFIDFDNAGPGPRIWDVAYAAYTFVPLAGFTPLPDGSTTPYLPTHAAERLRRVRLFCEAYGSLFPSLIETVERRLESMCELMVDRAAAGDAAYVRLTDEGHLEHYRQEIAFVRQHGLDWQPESV